ncbi:MAG: signal peptidase I [Candidatus Sungbacteria bacterium]|nr:signal peptidase I [Candidatus Sungbacteria bacterium]
MSEEQVTGIDEKSQAGGWRKEAWEIAKVLLVSLVIVLPIRYFLVQPFIVRGASMEPNFENREYLIVDEASYYFRAPKRGEAIVFRYPKDPRQFFIKRIIGLPGERVEVKDGQVRIINQDFPDGLILEESYLEPLERLTYPDISADLGSDQFFVLGDNRDASSDSRVWGPLEKRFITGRALLRAWPLRQFGFVAGPILDY